MKIKKYDNFINEELNIDSEAINKWIWRGILPAVIVYRLVQYGYQKDQAEKKVKYAIEHFVDASQIFRKEIEYARNVAINKAIKFNDPNIIECIKNIPIRIGEAQENALAQFEEFNGVVCIVINKDLLTKLNNINELKNTLTHELFHYVDFLTGNWSKINANTINLIIDKENLTKEKLFNKLVLILLKKNPDEIRDQGTYDALREVSDRVYNEIDYYTSPKEMYARFQNLRQFMFKKGYLDSINSDITKESLIKLLEDRSLYKEIEGDKDIIPLLMIIKFNTSDLNKIAQLGNGEIPNIT
jgi:hypothetical protein